MFGHISSYGGPLSFEGKSFKVYSEGESFDLEVKSLRAYCDAEVYTSGGSEGPELAGSLYINLYDEKGTLLGTVEPVFFQCWGDFKAKDFCYEVGMDSGCLVSPEGHKLYFVPTGELVDKLYDCAYSLIENASDDILDLLNEEASE